MPADVSLRTGLTVPGGQAIEGCLPKPAKTKLPVLVLIHSGSFTGGSYQDLRPLCYEGAEHGFATFSAEYRFLPAVFPSQLDDVAAAIRWLQQPAQAAAYGLNDSRISLIGTSAGGVIAAQLLTGVTGSPLPPSTFTSGVLLSGGYDFSPARIGPFEQIMLAYLGCSSAAACPATTTAAPVTHAARTDPPMLIINSTHELQPIANAESFDAALTKAGAPHTLLKVDGNNHAESILAVHRDVDATMWDYLEAHAR